MVERVKPGTTPLSDTVAPVRQEILDPSLQAHMDGGSDLESDEDAAPEYKREDQGPRVGADPEDAAKQMAAVGDLKKQLDGEDLVPCIFIKPVHLQDKGLMHHWAPGVHMVPVSLAGGKDTNGVQHKTHWWLKDNKVRRAGNVMKNENALPAEADAEE